MSKAQMVALRTLAAGGRILFVTHVTLRDGASTCIREKDDPGIGRTFHMNTFDALRRAGWIEREGPPNRYMPMDGHWRITSKGQEAVR